MLSRIIRLYPKDAAIRGGQGFSLICKFVCPRRFLPGEINYTSCISGTQTHHIKYSSCTNPPWATAMSTLTLVDAGAWCSSVKHLAISSAAVALPHLQVRLAGMACTEYRLQCRYGSKLRWEKCFLILFVVQSWLHPTRTYVRVFVFFTVDMRRWEYTFSRYILRDRRRKPTPPIFQSWSLCT